MMQLWGYDGYTVTFLTSAYYTSSKNQYKRELKCSYYYWIRNPDTTVLRMYNPEDPIMKKLTESRIGAKELKQFEVITSKQYLPKPGEVLYFDKSCTIPRIKCEGTWKRTVKLAKADVVVVPEFSAIDYKGNIAVFANDETKELWAMVDATELLAPLSVGMTFDEMDTDNSRFINNVSFNADENKMWVEKAKDSKCVYIGPLLIYNKRQQYMFDIIDGIYPKIVFEQELLNQLGGEDEMFTPEIVSSLIELLSSKDKDSVHQGMRTLASMDYAHYPSITKYILNQTSSSWSQHKPFNSAVKFMMDSLNYGTYGFYEPFTDVSAEEFSIARAIFENIFRSEIQSTYDSLQRRTNIKIDFGFDVELTLPDKKELTEEQEEALEESEDVDWSFIDKD